MVVTGATRRVSQVAVLIPNYNNASYLRQCLLSVCAQTLTDWRAVVGDNASTDDSVAVIKAIDDPRIRLVERTTTVPWVANVNLLLEQMPDADYIAVLHADDWWEPRFLEVLVGLLEGAAASIMASCAWRIVSPGASSRLNGLHMGRSSLTTTCSSAEALRLLTEKNWLCSSAIVARRSLYHRFPRFDESFPHVNDWLMWIRAASAGNIEVAAQPLANYRMHDSSSGAEARRANRLGEEMVRLARTLQAEWADAEPVEGLRRAVASGVAAEILADAGVRAERGDTVGALVQARLARSIAPSFKQQALAVAAEQVINMMDLPGLRLARRPAAELGRRLWDIVRPAA
jgi:Glycosyl transferase family 2